MAVLGIDLGYTGAIVLLSNNGALLDAVDMPITIIEGRRYVDESKLVNLIKDDYLPFTNHAYVERLGARPGQGVSSMFRFGYGAGVVQGVLKALGFYVHAFLPQTWKKAAGVTADKQTSLDLAQTLWPENPELWNKAKYDGRAEAALIGLYGLEQLAQC